MTMHLIIGAAITLLVVSMWKLLWAAVFRPTPGGAVIFTSALYLLGAAVTEWRYGTPEAGYVFAVSITCFLGYVISYLTVIQYFRLESVPPVASSMVVGGTRARTWPLWLFFVSMFLLMVLAIVSTGTEQLLLALYSFVTSGSSDTSVLTLRLEVSSGANGWMAPGYVAQIRDILLPFSVLLLLFTVRRRAFHFLFLACVVVPATVALMLSSGERGPVVLFTVGLLYAAWQAAKIGVISRRLLTLLSVMVLVFGGGIFYAVTSSLGARLGDSDASIATLFVDRVVTRLPEENVHSAGIWTNGAPFMGAGWLSEIGSILPGTQQTLSNQLHAELGGGELGNSPLGLWPDIFYNFGWWLCIPVSALLGLLMAVFNHWVIAARSRSEVAEICGLWLSTTMLSVISPFTFMLYGPFVLSAILFLLPRSRWRQVSVSVVRPCDSSPILGR